MISDVRERITGRRKPQESKSLTIKNAHVDVILQRVEEDIGAELKVIPAHIRRYGVNNIFQRVFSYLLGWTIEEKPVKLIATKVGELKVASVGTRYEEVDTKTGIATGIESETITFDHLMSKIEVIPKAYDMFIRISSDKVIWQDWIFCLANEVRSIDMNVFAFQVRRSTLNDVEYEVIGYR